MADLGSSRARTLLYLCLVVAAVGLTFANTLRNELHLDDGYRVAGNPELDRFWPPWRHFLDPRTSTTLPTIEQYRPLLPLSLSFGVAVGRRLGIDRLVGHHLGSIAIHLATCLLLYFLLRELLAQLGAGGRLEEQDRSRLVLGAVLLFAVHPVAGVPVNYVSARDLLLMMLFATASLLAYTRMRRRGDSGLGWGLSLVLLAFSLLAKQNSVVLPAIVLAFELLRDRGALRRPGTWLRPLPFVAVVAAFFLWTEVGLGFSDLEQLESTALSPWLYACTMARLHTFYYLRNAAWPFLMRPLPEVEAAGGLLDPGVLLGGLVLLSSLALAWTLRRRAPAACFCILVYWLWFAPTSSIRPFRYLVADYRQYPSLPFLALLVALVVARLAPRLGRRVGLPLLVLYLGLSSVFMNRIWRTEESLWEQAVRYGTRSQGHVNYARSLDDSDPQLALRHYRLALRKESNNVYAHVNLGMLLIRTDRREEGLAAVREAVARAPNWGLTHHWLAEAHGRLGDREAAAAERRLAADLDPRNLAYQYQAALDLQRLGDHRGSLRYLERIAVRDPGYRQALFLEAYALQALDRFGEAEPRYRAFLERRADHAQAWFNLGHGLATEGRCAEAIESLEQVPEGAASAEGARLWLGRCRLALEGGVEGVAELRGQAAGEARRRGLAALRRGATDEAVAALRRAAELDPASAQVPVDLCFALLRAGEAEEAIDVCSLAVERAPENLDARHNLGYAYRIAGRYDEAVERFEAVLAASPKRVVTLYELAKALELAGRRDEARKAAERTLLADPAHGAARALLAELEN